jgi:hypothetical protein
MDLKYENPFSNCGGIVEGNRFIGREPEIRKILNRVIMPWDGGNLALVGDYRIGKSSLAYHAVMAKRSELRDLNICPLWLNIGTFNSSQEVFRAMVRACADELNETGQLSSDLEGAKEKVLQSNTPWDEERELIQQFFKKVRKQKVKVVIVLDEFDHTRILFKNDIAAFQFLRDLNYYPEWRISFLICSRRTIKDIEMQTAAISTFDGACMSLYLQTFSQKDQNHFFSKLSSIGVAIDENLRRHFAYYTGGHPFLMDILAAELVDQFLYEDSIDLEKAAGLCEHHFVDKYDHMTKILEEDQSLEKLIQILFGPSFNVNNMDISHLERFGLVRVNKDGLYETYSPHYQAYLRLLGRRLNFWPAWKTMEDKLRSFLGSWLDKKFGQDWAIKLERQDPDLKPIIHRWRGEREQERKHFQSLAAQDVLEYASPSDLLTVAMTVLDARGSFLKENQSEWLERAQFLARIKRPLSPEEESISQNTKDQAEMICEEIIAALDLVL